MGDSEFLVALTLIVVGAFYIIERIMSFSVIVYQWYFKAVTRDMETTRYDAGRVLCKVFIYSLFAIEFQAVSQM